MPKTKKTPNPAARALALMRRDHRSAKKIEDQFTGLNVSKEYRRQLRRRAQGLCIVAGCPNRLATANHCGYHADEFNKRRRIRYHQEHPDARTFKRPRRQSKRRK
jgi:hypothetical protein